MQVVEVSMQVIFISYQVFPEAMLPERSVPFVTSMLAP